MDKSKTPAYPTRTLYEDWELMDAKRQNEILSDFNHEGVHPHQLEDNSVMELIQDDLGQQWNDLMANLKLGPYKNQEVLICGTLGLWDGTKWIQPVRIHSIAAALNKITNVRFQYSIRVTLSSGEINVEQVHHDGTNHFTIRPLSKLGTEKLTIDKLIHLTTEDEKKYTKKFKGYLF